VKDNFSDKSSEYARYRPLYPDQLFEFLYTKVNNYTYAWDCGTGNGQVADQLAEKFTKVVASDISQNQLNHAVGKENIEYVVSSAEHTPFADNLFDLITVAQAIHWFDFDAFYKEVFRVSKNGAVLAVWGYGLVTVNEKVDKVIGMFYRDIVGKYWDKERKYIDERYTTISFPVEELPVEKFQIIQQWDLQHFIHYINTWSSVKKFKQAEKSDPTEKLFVDLKKIWHEESRQITFPIFMRIGKIRK
jgi:ubiquinone/menaquinone biosynthesis C-methylase UbiE